MKKKGVLLLLIIVIAVYGCAPASEVPQQIPENEPPEINEVQDNSPVDTPQSEPVEPSEVLGQSELIEKKKPLETSQTWKNGELIIPGNFADPDMVKLSDGSYRIYYAIEPEVPGNNLEIFSATSADGVTWKQEPGVRRTRSVFPDVVQTSEGGWRMYFQEQPNIRSAISGNGLKWTEESGVRIDKSNSFGFTIENVAAPTTLLMDDGTYLMVYSGSINKRYDIGGAKVPNRDMRVLLWATSKDGLSWEKKGIALDARNPVLEGFADGPDLVHWSDGRIRLYFWGYKGIYYSVFDGKKFSEPVMAFEAPNPNNFLYPSDPPGDPTLIKIGDTWHMYYGIWKKGIFYTTLDK